MSFVIPPNVSLVQPGKIILGPGCVHAAFTELAQAGHRRVLIITSPSVRPHAEKASEVFGAASAFVEILTGIPPEPTVACCETLRRAARTFAPDLVIAIGGGSVLDVAKLVAALHDRTEPLEKFFGIGVLTGRRTALVCVPTTGGTGSEVSPNALLFDETSSSKKAIISPALVPDIAIVDAQLMQSLPPELTATVGLDALTHCLEAYANKAAHPTLDLYALEGVRLVSANLAQAVAHGDDLAARSAVALGSLYGGLCLGPVNTAGVHALAYPLGGEFHLAHGLSIALLLPHVVRFNCGVMIPRHAALAKALGATGTDECELATALPAKLEALCAACGLNSGLSKHGIPRDALGRLADEALLVTRLLKNNPRDISRADAVQIYEAAF